LRNEILPGEKVLAVTAAWKVKYPDAFIGVLAMRGVTNPERHPVLDEKKAALEKTLRDRFSAYDRATLQAIPVLAAYRAYYKRFKKSYHVQHQLESVAQKKRAIPKVSTLVEAMFMAELNNLLLTAGHDLDTITLPLRADVADGSEGYIRLNGEAQTVRAGDMMIADADGVLSCIVYGPDSRTRIRPETERVLFIVYAPPGIDATDVERHLAEIRDNVTMVVPNAGVELLEVMGAS
jgi:DNA/RNA-binding domain of Phe-tRNA-synthetase-like protein